MFIASAALGRLIKVAVNHVIVFGGMPCHRVATQDELLLVWCPERKHGDIVVCIGECAGASTFVSPHLRKGAAYRRHVPRLSFKSIKVELKCAAEDNRR